MAKILGLDLGTNSIGWAIRDTETIENQIINYGVVVFKKGVGNSKSGEFSLAAERRKNRGKRRLYNSKRYRKWATLRVLSQNCMCPISEEELNLWSIGEWKDYGRNKGRIYPTSPDFRAWLAMDEKYFGNKGKIKNRNGEESYIRKSPYDLRCELIKDSNHEDELRLYKIGRAFYHLVQRRGFQTNRKNGNSDVGIDAEYEQWRANTEKPSVSKYYLEKLSSGERIRGRHSMKREYVLEDDFRQICKTQGLDKLNAKNSKEKQGVTLEKALEKAIYFVRPLKGQKGLVGKCTLEKGKPRIPISHPYYEEFRALQFVNNLQWRKTNSNEKEEQIPIAIRKKIFEELFFRISKPYFDFEEIIKRFSNDNEYTFNYRNKPSVAACPIIACIKSVFMEQWKDPFLKNENEIGINWNGLNIPFKLSDRTIQRKQEENNKRTETSKAALAIKNTVAIEEIWHLAFDHLQTKETKHETFLEIIKDKFDFNDGKAEEFCRLEKTMQQGYGALSKTAINKINQYLRIGYIYSEAVFYANMKTVLGEDIFSKNKEKIICSIKKAINYVDDQKEKLTIVNGLIQQDFGQRQSNKALGLTEKIIAVAKADTTKRLIGYFGENKWNNLSEEKQKEYYDFIFEKFCAYLNGDQKKEEKASVNQTQIKEIDYYKLPRIDSQIKKLLQKDFNTDPKKLEKLYHPSDIEIYPTARYAVDKETGEQKNYKLLGDPMPPSKGWKNPMAMRTMHELRKLINYLLTRKEDAENGIIQIDENTRIVVEVARELNTANMRKAIEDWQTDRDKEHKLFTDRMQEMGSDLSDTDYNKMRVAMEQIDINEISDPEFKKKYKEFINIFLKKKSQTSQTENEEIIEDDIENKEGSRNYDYIMYLILMKDKFSQMLNSKIPDTNKFIRQILTSTKDFTNKKKELQNLFLRYVLWKEQKFECFYTGKKIMLSDLFDGTKYQLEHTIPRSKSFDSELKNLTIADAAYNNFTKDNSFPTDCPNYNEEAFCKTVNGLEKCSPIKDRVERLIKPKRDELESRVRSLENAAKKIPDWETDKKNANIRLRHYLQMELDYWDKKYFTFTVKKEDWKDKFKNSQLVDTQLITKYARAYMKSVFRNVEVQKGVITSVFRNIYQLPQKTRDNHSHHALDAAVLTLIPTSAVREEELKEYYLYEESIQKQEKTEQCQRIISDYESSSHIPTHYRSFNVKHILNIKEEVLINHVSKDQTFTIAKKYKRKRRKIEPLKDKNNKIIYDTDTREKKKIIITGKSVRGQLHLDSFYGAIKPNERNDKGFVMKNNDGYILKQKNGEDEIWLVHRKEIDKANLTDMIDVLLRDHIEKQLQNGIKINEVVDFNNKRIRHVRCRIKTLTKEKAIYFKNHIFKSKHIHKQQYIAGNAPGSNYLNILYEGINPKKEIIRAYRIISLFEFAELGITNVEILKDNAYKTVIKGRGKSSIEIGIKKIFKVGDKVMMWYKSIEELNNITSEEKIKRLYTIFKFNNAGSDYMFLQHHLEARPDAELGDGDTSFNPEKYQPRLKLSADKFNCLIEHVDFKINIDGTISNIKLIP